MEAPPTTTDAPLVALSPENVASWQAGVWADPVGYVNAMFGIELWSKQAEVLEAIRDHPRVAVPSCNAAGKSFLSACAAHVFSEARAPSYVVITGASWTGIEKVVWPWIHKLHNAALSPLGGELLNIEWKRGLQWGVFSVSPNQPERFAGFRTENGVMVIVDEASSLDRDIHEAILGLTASYGSRILYIGNPLRTTGPFYDACEGSAKENWKVIPISAFDTPNVDTGRNIIQGLATKEDVQSLKIELGENSAAYSARVLGEFPATGENSFFDGAVLRMMEKEYARKPRYEGAIAFDWNEEKGEVEKPRLDMDRQKADMQVWCELDEKFMPRPDRNYVLGIDVSKGSGASNSVISVLDTTSMEQVAVYASADPMPHDLSKIAAAIGKWFGGQIGHAFIIHERNGDGMVFGRELVRIKYPFIYKFRDVTKEHPKRQDVIGWHSSRASKAVLLQEYRRALAHEKILIRSVDSFKEAHDYVYFDDGSIGPSVHEDITTGAREAHGDRVIADALAFMGLGEQRKAKQPDAPIPESSFAYRRKRARRDADTEANRWR